MTIKSKAMLHRKITIDLTGPQGNAHVLRALARTLCRELGKDFPAIDAQMKAGDYENLVQVFDREFSAYVDLYR
jgi:hypothetical protein